MMVVVQRLGVGQRLVEVVLGVVVQVVEVPLDLGVVHTYWVVVDMPGPSP